MALREFYGRRRSADCIRNDGNDDRFASTTSLSLLTRRKNATRMVAALTGLHFQRLGIFNPVTYLSGRINENRRRNHSDATRDVNENCSLGIDCSYHRCTNSRQGGKRVHRTCPRRDCTEKAINQFVLLLDRLQLPAMHRRRGATDAAVADPALFLLQFSSQRFMARQQRKICGSSAMEAWKSGKGEERKSMPGDNFFPFRCLRPVKLRSPTTKKPIMSLYSPSVTRSDAIKSR
ncbi:Uncharacterized protein DBV15_07252 [Temnothorax longispinosus]|uniref:Uncharacterized protein n=1 Tax=Temnothorax longispinosus TaxID=300112 RepID=A0A4S2JJ77_9HYME|nr:Uncharacterized protein DBV15_07252 [Temnothorax longispinosus]